MAAIDITHTYTFPERGSWEEVNETLMLLRLCVGECRLCKKQLMKTEIKTARGMLMTLQGWYLICVNVCVGVCVALLLGIVCESLVWAGPPCSFLLAPFLLSPVPNSVPAVAPCQPILHAHPST